MPTTTVSIPLDHYLQIVFKSHNHPVISDDYCIVSKEIADYIKSVKDYDAIAHLESIDEDDYTTALNLKLIRPSDITSFYRLYRQETWLVVHIAQVQRELERKEKRRLEIIELSKREARLNEVIQKIMHQQSIDYKTARVLVYDYILKGLMNQVADIYGISDLVNKEVSKKV